MKDKLKNIDDLVFNALKEYSVEPNEQILKDIRKRMFVRNMIRLYLLNKYQYYLIALPVVALISYFVFFNISTPASTTDNTIVEVIDKRPGIPEETDAITKLETGKNRPDKETIIQEKTQPQETIVLIEKTEPIKTHLAQNKTKPGVIYKKNVEISEVVFPQVIPDNSNLEQIATIGIDDIEKYFKTNNKSIDISSIEMRKFSNYHFSNTLLNDYVFKPYFSLGLQFSPETIYYKPDNKPTQRSYAFDLALSYNYANTFIQSGLGISHVEDMSGYKINYDKNDFIGTYMDVDSIGYIVTIDTAGNQVVERIYYTSFREIYDSVNYNKAGHTKNSYKYLNIPLIFGLKKNWKRFTFSLKGGAILSLLINKNEEGINYFEKGVTIRSIIDERPNRIKTNWQFLIGLGCNYQLTNKLSVGVEPIYRYYINNVYSGENGATKPDYSFGIRTGIYWNL